MPFAIAQSHQFYLLSPEAFLLTVLLKEKAIANNKINKERGAVRARGWESGPCIGSDRPDLIFWLLLDQAKSDKPPRQLSGRNTV
ncbi:MAG: hypothetical protein JWQ79_2750 [Mucilaginibacter sp.]|nr:hypothetical protein [Mucilaginibacter sp.]